MCKDSGGIAMSIDFQFAPKPQVAESNPPAIAPPATNVEQGSEWLTILEGLFQIEPEISPQADEAVPSQPVVEINSLVPPAAITFLAAFFAKESLANSSGVSSAVEPEDSANSETAEFVAELNSRGTKVWPDEPSLDGQFDLVPELWELLPSSGPIVGSSVVTEVRPDLLRSDPHSDCDAPTTSPAGTAPPDEMAPNAARGNNREIASAVFSMNSPTAGDEIPPELTRPDAALIAFAEKEAPALPVHGVSPSQGFESESREQSENRDGKPSEEMETIPEENASKAGDVAKSVGADARFSLVGHRHLEPTGARSVENRSSLVSFATEVDAAMAGPEVQTRPGTVSLDLRISQGDLGLPEDSSAGELRLQLRQRGDEIQMRIHGTGEGIAGRAQQEWTGLVERLRPLGLDAERASFVALHPSQETEVRPLHPIETMQGEGNGNTEADGQRRQHDRDQRQEQQRNHQERARRQNDMKSRFSSFLNW